MTHPESAESSAPVFCLVGPTAVGKTAFALELCESLAAHVVSLDSMQVYRGLDIGTAKPGPAERARVPHECLDLVGPEERYDVSRYLADSRAACERIRQAGARALFVGGAGLYLKALARGLFAGPPVDPELRRRLNARASELGSPALHAELFGVDPGAAARIHPNDGKRVVRALEVFEQTGRRLSDWQQQWGWNGDGERPRPLRIVGLRLSPEVLAARIEARVRAMLDQGWVEEARAVRAAPGFGPTAIQALGYREVLEHADGLRSRADCERRIVELSRQFVRRQNTWFRSFPEIRWLDPGDAASRRCALDELEGRGVPSER